MTNQTGYVLWGSSGHAKVLASLIALRGGHVEALFDNNPQATSALLNVPLFIGVEGFIFWKESEPHRDRLLGYAAIGGARGQDRQAIQELFYTHGIQTELLVHPHASVCATAILGKGTQILAHALVAADTKIGESCIVNHGASVDHECILGIGVHLAPSATLCGCVTLGNNVFIGAGATVLPKVTIGENTVIGAGAIVTKNIPAGVIAVGNPARVIKKRG